MEAMTPVTALFDPSYLKRRSCNPAILEQVTLLAIEIAREGREGRKVGAIFTIDDAEAVLARSRPLILDPLAGHADEVKRLDDPNLRETVKELAQLDGAFVVDGRGVVVSACRYLDAGSEGVALPLGLGSRHMAAAAMSRRTEAVSVVVSESSMVRIFDDGELVSEIIPEVWMLHRYSSMITGRTEQRSDEQVMVVSKQE